MSGGGKARGGGIRVGDHARVGGDVFTGDKRTTFTGGGNYYEGMADDSLTHLFDVIYQRIQARPEDPDVDKAELAETVRNVQQEVTKGEEANPNKVARWLEALGKMAPDILEVTAAALSNPVAGIAVAMRRVAARVRQERGSR